MCVFVCVEPFQHGHVSLFFVFYPCFCASSCTPYSRRNTIYIYIHTCLDDWQPAPTSSKERQNCSSPTWLGQSIQNCKKTGKPPFIAQFCCFHAPVWPDQRKKFQPCKSTPLYFELDEIGSGCSHQTGPPSGNIPSARVCGHNSASMRG